MTLRRGLAVLIQAIGILMLRPWVLLCFQMRVRRARGLPEGACVYASNHRSFADPSTIAMWSRIPVAFFARSSLWDILPIRIMLDIFAGIPVERENPGMSSMKGAIERLRAGIPVLVFPEGTRTRNGRLGPLRDGPALFARRAGVPLVPVFLHRSEAMWPRGALLPRPWGARMEIRFGRPISAPAGLDPRAQDAWVMRRLGLWMLAQERELQGRPSSQPSHTPTRQSATLSPA
jgi:1-acyl-sn-glycerol-3-phosphate acyltransferase